MPCICLAIVTFFLSELTLFPHFPSLEMANKQKGNETPKLQKKICQREQEDSPRAERNCMSLQQKREILDDYSKLPKMTKEEAASKLNTSSPLLYKLLKE